MFHAGYRTAQRRVKRDQGAPGLRLRHALLLGGVAALLAACGGRSQPAEPQFTEADVQERLQIIDSLNRRRVCPRVNIRRGTQGFPIYERGHDLDPAHLRFQGSLGETARECNITLEGITMRVGASGRVLLGPKGAPEQAVELPVRFVVLYQDNEPVYSELKTIPVSVPVGQTSARFEYVAENIAITRRPGDTIGDYTVQIGFDGGPAAGQAQ